VNGWTELVTTALLGTDRRPVPAQLAEPWTRFDSADPDPAGRLLDLAAAYRAAARTGGPAPRVAAAGAVPSGQRDAAPDAAQQVLERLLLRPDPLLITLWLTGCADHGFTVAPQLWTSLADHLARHRRYPVALLRSAFGTQGRWFLDQNPRWSRLSKLLADGQEATEADIQIGRAERAELGQRRNQRALAAVRLEPDSDRGPILIITPPPVDEAMRVDGVSPRPPAGSRIGAGAYVLRQLVTAAAADLWPTEWNESPPQILDLVLRTAPQWREDLVDGWAAAAVRDAHAGWAAALTEAGYRGRQAAALHRLVPVQQRLAIVMDWLRADRQPEMILELLLSWPEPWPRQIWLSALRLLGTRALGSASVDYASAIGARIPLSDHDAAHEAADYYLNGVDRPASTLMLVRTAFAAVDQTMQLRAEIDQAFGQRSTVAGETSSPVAADTRRPL
jgi:hypothetical protein